MNQHLSKIQDLLQQDKNLSEADKEALVKAITDADKQWAITDFKLDRTEKVKKTTAILLEETIAELEQKRKAVEAQNRELEIESALERVRSIAMGMKESADMLEICRTIAHQLELLGVKEIRNVQTAIFYEEKGTYMNYEYYAKHDKTFITETTYTNNEIHQAFADQMLKGNGEFFVTHIKGKEVKDWLAYQKTTNVFIDDYLNTASSLNYYWYSLGPVALGISTYEALKDEETILFRRFLKVFELSYTRYLDIEKAEAQAREAQIELGLERVRARAMAMHKSDELLEAGALLYSELSKLGIEKLTSGYMLIDEDGKMGWNYGVNPGTGQIISQPVGVSLAGTKEIRSIVASWKKQEPIHVLQLDPQETIAHQSYMADNAINFPISKEKLLSITPERLVIHTFNFKHGYLLIVREKLLSEEQQEMVVRFARVFEMTYRRFLDLKKAESQAREAQIQLALERVRARTMAMYKSEELGDISFELVKQVQSLGVATWHCAFNIYDEDQNSSTEWGSNAGGTYPRYKTPRIGIFLRYYEIGQTGETLHIEVIGEDKCADHYAFLCTLPGVGEELVKLRDSGVSFPTSQIDHVAYFKYGYLLFITYEPVPEAHDIFKRFAKVFEQTYTRFLDLQKAEAQAREAQIETALERVRSRTMAMQRSDELVDTAALLFQQIKELGIHQWGNSFQLWEDDMKAVEAWTCTQGLEVKRFKIPTTVDPVMANIVKAAQKGEILYVEEMGGEVLEDHYKFMYSLPIFKEILDNLAAAGITPPKFQVMYAAYFSYGYILFITHEPNPEAQDIFKRFAKVFEQTYTRFNDLKKAEAQARESQIEAALERVRSRTMGMQKSEELKEVIQVVYEQFRHLNIFIGHAGFIMDYKASDNMNIWLADPHEVPTQVTIPYFDSPHWNSFIEAKEKGLDFFANHLSFEEKNKFYQGLFNVFPGVPNEAKEYYFSCPGLAISTVLLENVGLYIENFSGIPYSDEENATLMRFGKVFQQTYTRFLDLQKAEAQARDAQIEAALERVRSRTMGMQHSKELIDVATILFQEVKGLGVPQWNCGLNIWEIGDKEFTYYPGNPDGQIGAKPCKIPLTEDPIFILFDESRRRGDELWVQEIAGEVEKAHYRYMLALPGGLGDLLQGMLDAGLSFPEFQIDHIANFSHGNLLFITYEHFPEMHDIFKRFAKVFEQTYTRFLDLQKAEAQARDAIKQASVDRVRAEIASMRTTADLERITPLIWSELTTLGVPFIRCGVFIMDDEQQQIKTHLSTPDGEAIAAFNLPYNAPGETAEILAHWHKKELYKQHWDEAQFIEFTQNLVQQGAVTSGEKYLTENRPTDLYLHFLPFLQGMLYAGNTSSLSDDALHLMQNLADAFSTAYARYEDFNKLEVAKKQVDSALDKLQATQKQLIQAEKMASLGELTAGIAHEIQNPLNFVNNFSEVNKEMIAELKEEIDKGNYDEVKIIADDIEANEEKINHHGKRADAIVKGMLQHSRKSEGVKEPTDINALCDEYLRLSYHGFRAKDKSFNTDFKTDFDETIGKINVIPQDIGRVLLNLFNNAFYTVNEKQKTESSMLKAEGDQYVPTVTVVTKKLNEKVEIIVKDNGNGIPSSIKDKIFQPFFTTKPTGQGTGLGLSLAYDIIKAHGGEIKVRTQESADLLTEATAAEKTGTIFTIQLPANSN